MTRKHFIAIAAMLDAKRAATGDPDDIILDLAHDFANIAIADNPNFDEARFIEACGF